MARSLSPTLPRFFHAMMEALRERSADDAGRVWIGEAGFHRELIEARSEQEQLRLLARHRWPAMQPDLLPFACDGAGNQFCLIWNAREDGRGDGHVVYWQYETYVALPIASSMESFGDWLGLTTAFSARHDLNPILDDEHLSRDVLPLLAELRPGVDYLAPFSAADSDLESVHAAITMQDARAAGSLLWLGARADERGETPRAVSYADRAIEAFPDLSGAWMDRAAWRERTHHSQALRDMLEGLRVPLMYSGDRQMPWYGDVAIVDPTRAVEELATSGEFNADELTDPLWEVILHEDPLSSEAWSRVALDYVDFNELYAALAMAQNALYLGFQEELAPQGANLLAELYEALQCSWHEALAREDEERLLERARSRGAH